MDETILIIDDNRLNLKLFNDLVVAIGRRPISASSGGEGIALARHHRPNLAIVDIQLPDISGLEVIQILRGERALRSIPIVATSAFQSSAAVEWLLQHQCEGFVAKPVLARPFLELLEKLLRDATMAAEMLPQIPAARLHVKSDASAAAAG